MIEVRGLSKSFGPVRAVSELSFEVAPGTVTAFLGPNGAGKTTTMRMLLGLVRPSAGSATIGGRRYADLPSPSSQVGAVLDTSGCHPAHSVHDHLRVYARMGGHPRSRVAEVMELTGAVAFAGRRTRTLSTGMRRRVQLATALLGDPAVLVLDEPANGLDPEGIAWLRGFLRDLAGQGRAILVSSHVLSEVEQVAGQVVMIRQGRLVTAGPVRDLYGAAAVHVRSPQAERLRAALRGGGVTVEARQPGVLRVRGLTAPEIAAAAARHGIALHELTQERPTLEQAFLDLTGGTS
ncbi:ABC transporter ATP-binding protein [Nonomuraea gerenzanensis]|uniref:ABC transporter, ATP-binding protein n=1 Tax=Nonomuraea gerenzanensis TaxID=93944 RepID=A0A1M4DZS8_9ACTN|nr:ATP-binding cassette domain-containing protein [Nonomuraea gerenzanensis]UBU14369.1 ATP-binding cassette domain-containing protein [Nonomuraea gerenzanensis]SBO92076.1 ABC transporter, ATP-binding protein [Nonomuraea gerenzanensis]